MGPDSPFALLSPVLGSEIPFEKGFLENQYNCTNALPLSALFWGCIAITVWGRGLAGGLTCGHFH